MAIFAQPAGIWPGPTLMGRVLPGPIRNRVGYGFLKKTSKRVQVGFRFYQKNPKPDPKPNPDITRLKLQKKALYIYRAITNPSPSFVQQQLTPPSQLLTLIEAHSSSHSHLIHPHSHSRRLPQAITITVSRSHPPHGRCPPQALTLTHPHDLTLTQPLLLHAFQCPPRRRR